MPSSNDWANNGLGAVKIRIAVKSVMRLTRMRIHATWAGTDDEVSISVKAIVGLVLVIAAPSAESLQSHVREDRFVLLC